MAGRRLLDDFLANLHDLDPAFETWLSIQHESLREQGPDAPAGTGCREDTEFGSERVAAAIRNVDPTNEAACRVLMQCCFGRGDVAGALRRLPGPLEPARFRMRHGTVGADAGAGCRNQECRSGAGRRHSRRRRRPAAAGRGEIPGRARTSAEPPRILVRAFDDDGVGETDMRRVNGFRHDLIAALTRFRSWSVHEHAAAAGAMPCRGTGGLRTPRHGHTEDGRIRMAVLLRRHCDGHYVWSERPAIDVGDWYRAKLPSSSSSPRRSLSGYRRSVRRLPLRMPDLDRDIPPAILPRRTAGRRTDPGRTPRPHS